MAPSRDINDPNTFVFYRYHPSLLAAVIFVLFGLTPAVHVYQMYRKRAWFLVPFIIGGLLETVGYIGRALSSNDQWDNIPYIIQSLLLILAPALFVAPTYMILGCIIRLTKGEKFPLIRSSRLIKIFVSGDVFCFFLQAAGGDKQAAAGKHQDSDKRFAKIAENLAEYIIIEGLGTQIVFFEFLVVIAAVFHYRGCRHFTTLDPQTTCRKHLHTLYGTSTLILVRSVFRIVESVQETMTTCSDTRCSCTSSTLFRC